jgi:hypothetical protein
MATAAAIAAPRATALANVVVVGGSDKDGFRDGRDDKGSDGCGEGNGIGDDGSNCGGDGDGNGCSVFGVNGGIYGIDNAATKSMKTMTTT